jgi:hypothetical protein
METKGYYTEAVKKAVKKYRANHIEEYNEFQRLYYHKKKDDAEWKEQFNIRCREANKRYRDKKKENTEVKPRGRPRKIFPAVETLMDLPKNFPCEVVC